MTSRNTYNSSLTAALKQSATLNSLMHDYQESKSPQRRAQPFREPKVLSPVAALRSAGLRSPPVEDDLEATSSSSSVPSSMPSSSVQDSNTWCLCGADKTELKDLTEENLTRCSNRECPYPDGLFHLTCAKLPDHPPRYVFWFCPTCMEALAASTEPAVRNKIRFQSTLLQDWVRNEELLQREEREEDLRLEQAYRMRWLKRQEEEAYAVRSIETDEGGASAVAVTNDEGRGGTGRPLWFVAADADADLDEIL